MVIYNQLIHDPKGVGPGFHYSLLPQMLFRVSKNPAFGEGGTANSSVGWAKELKHAVQSLMQTSCNQERNHTNYRADLP